MGYFQVRYDSRVVIYDCKMFIRLATGWVTVAQKLTKLQVSVDLVFLSKNVTVIKLLGRHCRFPQT